MIEHPQTDDAFWEAIEAAEQADALWHFGEALWARLPQLAASPHREAVLGVCDILLDDFAYLVFTQMLDQDDAVACLHYLWQSDARVSWTDQGLLLTFPLPGAPILCANSGRFTARALAALMARAGRPWQPRDTFPWKPG
ncbi:MAG: hypothetical protein WC617_12940 [Rhodanobacter sp.]|jgi:hypothetical protein